MARPQEFPFSATPLTARQRNNHITSFFRRTCSDVLPLISPLHSQGTIVLFRRLFLVLLPSIKAGSVNDVKFFQSSPVLIPRTYSNVNLYRLWFLFKLSPEHKNHIKDKKVNARYEYKIPISMLQESPKKNPQVGTSVIS